jgi:hypothetical protein
MRDISQIKKGKPDYGHGLPFFILHMVYSI